jgi:hypothetical protein
MLWVTAGQWRTACSVTGVVHWSSTRPPRIREVLVDKTVMTAHPSGRADHFCMAFLPVFITPVKACLGHTLEDDERLIEQVAAATAIVRGQFGPRTPPMAAQRPRDAHSEHLSRRYVSRPHNQKYRKGSTKCRWRTEIGRVRFNKRNKQRFSETLHRWSESLRRVLAHARRPRVSLPAGTTSSPKSLLHPLR